MIKRLSYIAMTALLTAGLATSAMAQGKAEKKGQAAPATKAPDPCQSEKDAVKAAGKDAAKKKSANADLKKCTDAHKKPGAKKGKKGPGK